MNDEMPRVKQISISNDGILITYADAYDEPNTAVWLIDADSYKQPDGSEIVIYHSVCSKCGQSESGFPDEAGIYCRRCGFLMLNGRPGEFSKKEWMAAANARKAAEGGEPEE